MHQNTDYRGPGEDVYREVRALNTAYIAATTDLKGPQRGRLSRAPFLLFSVREDDIAWWDEALLDNRQGELLPPTPLADPELRRIQSAAISFLWQLCRRNTYAARIITGAIPAWCEKLVELPLVILLNRLGARDDLMISRLHAPAVGSERLLSDGVSAQQTVRRSSQLIVLQSLLATSCPDGYTRLPAAACSMVVPLRVREKRKNKL